MFRAFHIPLTWTELVKRTLREASADRCLGLAAELAYYFLLALVPALVFVAAVASFFPSRLIQDMLDALGRFAPPDVLTIVRDQLTGIQGGENSGILTFGLLLALWSSSAAIVSITDALNRAYDIDEGRPWWKVRLTAIGLTIGVALFILVGFALVVVGPQLAEKVAGWFGLGSAFVWAWWVLQWPIVFVLVGTGIGLVYYFAPDAEQDWVWLTPGSVLATALWMLFSLGFRFYVTNFADYNATYGAIGGVIVLLLWFYTSGLAILIGAELNSEIEHASPYGKDPGEKVPGVRKKIGLAAWRAWRERKKRHEPAGPPPSLPKPTPAPAHATRSRPFDMVLGGLIAGTIGLVRGRSRTRS
jgi:membrane protein